MKIPPIAIIAKKEFKDSITNRWFLVLSALFFLLVLQIPYISLVLLGLFPYSNIPGKIGTFLSVATSLGALITISIGALSISAEKEQRTISYLLSQPIRRIDVLIGKYIGLFLTISVIMVVGVGLALLPSFGDSNVTELGIHDFLYGVIILVGMSAVMLAISFAISVVSASRAMAISIALFIWLFLTVIYDIGLLGVTFIASGESQSFLYFILFNPIETTRIIAFILIRPEFTPSISEQFMIRYFGFNGSLVPLTISMGAWFAAAMMFTTIEFHLRDN
jgi:Cu-processing system permease protein